MKKRFNKIAKCCLSVLLAMKASLLIAGAQWASTWEINVDAPWRVEPSPAQDGVGKEYHSIPISVTINDARAWQYTPECGFNEENDATSCDREYTKMHQVISVTVTENNNPYSTKVVYTGDSNPKMIERTLGSWQPHTSAVGGVTEEPNSYEHSPITQDLCIGGPGVNCYSSSSNRLEDTSEWHMVFPYTPQSQVPGEDLELNVKVKIVYKNKENASKTGYFTQTLKVRLGEDELPRFSDNWAYGDLHYHSQGTDNSGEYGLSYRETLHTLGVLGMDFVFATDHASNNKQIEAGTMDLATGCYFTGGVNAVFGLVKLKPFADDGCLNNLFRTTDGLGDMSENRYLNHWFLLNGELNNTFTGFEGVNKLNQALWLQRNRMSGKVAVPQIYLGGEVDLIPEIISGEGEVGVIPGYQAYLHTICRDIPANHQGQNIKRIIADNDSNDELVCQTGWPSYQCGQSEKICNTSDILTPTTEGTDLIKDIQFKSLGFARQHILYLPKQEFGQVPLLSDTNTEGGASKRMRDLTAAMSGKAYFFLAHPLATASGNGISRLGPDILPYSENQLKEAFLHESFLGLQGWNENTRLKTDMTDERDNLHTNKEASNGWDYSNIPVKDVSNWEFDRRVFDNVNENIASTMLWDYVQQWGLNPNETSAISWLATGQPRKVFFAGGSDAHGDFNFRREGALNGTTAVVDTAIGKPRNLVHVGDPDGESNGIAKAFSQNQVLTGLKNGEFLVTDGPIVRLAYDVNQNGVIDDGDIPMGGTVNSAAPVENNGKYPLLVEWKSTEEFGPIEHLDLKIGSFSNQLGKGVNWGFDITNEPGSMTLDSLNYDAESGETYRRSYFGEEEGLTTLGYFSRALNSTNYTGQACEFEETSQNTVLRINFENNSNGADAHRYSGTCKISIDPDMFPSFRTATTQDYRYEPPQISRAAIDITSPDKLFVRGELYVSPSGSCGFAPQAINEERCNARRAYSNPIWFVIN
jgi:hypothetical protein